MGLPRVRAGGRPLGLSRQRQDERACTLPLPSSRQPSPSLELKKFGHGEHRAYLFTVTFLDRIPQFALLGILANNVLRTLGYIQHLVIPRSMTGQRTLSKCS